MIIMKCDDENIASCFIRHGISCARLGTLW